MGCVESWCADVHEIYLYQYILCMLMIAIGYPASSLLCYSIFSKILGPFPQVGSDNWMLEIVLYFYHPVSSYSYPL